MTDKTVGYKIGEITFSCSLIQRKRSSDRLTKIIVYVYGLDCILRACSHIEWFFWDPLKMRHSNRIVFICVNRKRWEKKMRIIVFWYPRKSRFISGENADIMPHRSYVNRFFLKIRCGIECGSDGGLKTSIYMWKRPKFFNLFVTKIGCKCSLINFQAAH